MKLLPLIPLLCFGCATKPVELTPGISAIMPPASAIGNRQSAIVNSPARLLIPLTWPDDYWKYDWQIWGTGDLSQPMQLLVSNVDMTQSSIPVPKFGECGFYEQRTIK